MTRPLALDLSRTPTWWENWYWQAAEIRDVSIGSVVAVAVFALVLWVGVHKSKKRRARDKGEE